jgi:hypothetical protein
VDLSSPTPETATIRVLDQQSLQQLREAEGLSPETIEPSRRCAAAIYCRHGAGNALQRAEGDFVLCTLPVPVLGRLQFAPPLSDAKQRAIRDLHNDSATKVLAVANRRF